MATALVTVVTYIPSHILFRPIYNFCFLASRTWGFDREFIVFACFHDLFLSVLSFMVDGVFEC